jgi:polysaccharide pyruvyl transferase WcaK-like protein
MRIGIYSRLNRLVSSSNPKYKPLQDFFSRADYVVVGHNGVFCAESCGVIHLARKAGKCTGILGSGSGIGRMGKIYKGWLYRRALDESDFCTFREHYTLRSMRHIYHTPDKLILAPDPAFAMRPAEPEAAHRVLERYETYQRARQSRRKVVGVTVLEKEQAYAAFMPELKGIAKSQAHINYLANIFDTLIKEQNAFVIFLPHSIEKHCNDIIAVKHTVEAMSCSPGDYMIIDQDCGARLLKSIIGACDFLIGERAHSIIGSVGMAIPFVAMTNRADLRMHGIIGDMCQCQEQIIDMDVLDEEASRQKVLALFDERESIKKSLVEIRRKLLGQLDAVSRIIKACKKDSNR